MVNLLPVGEDFALPVAGSDVELYGALAQATSPPQKYFKYNKL